MMGGLMVDTLVVAPVEEAAEAAVVYHVRVGFMAQRSVSIWKTTVYSITDFACLSV